jgi:hypothetical protein
VKTTIHVIIKKGKTTTAFSAASREECDEKLDKLIPKKGADDGDNK